MESAVCLADENTCVLSLQNGLGNVDVIKKYFAEEKIWYGLMEFAGHVIAPGHIGGNIGANACIYFGSYQKKITDRMRAFADIMTSGGLKANIKEDVDPYVWFKLRSNINNVVFGLLRLTIGHMAVQEGKNELLNLVVGEVDKVAKAKGIEYPEEKQKASAEGKKLSPARMTHIPSTAQDMKAKKITEVEFLNGAIYKEGQKLGIDTPYNELLYRMVKIYENTYDVQY